MDSSYVILEACEYRVKEKRLKRYLVEGLDTPSE